MKWILGLGAVGAAGAAIYYYVVFKAEMRAHIRDQQLSAGLPAGMQMSQMAGYYR